MRQAGKVQVTAESSGRISLSIAGQDISIQVNHAVTPPTTYVWVNKGLVAELR